MKVLFIDRDGTLIVEPKSEQVDTLEELEFVPGIIRGLQLLQQRGFTLVMISNQDHLGSRSYPLDSFNLVQKKLLSLLEGEGIHFSEIFICPHGPNDNCDCRKPKIGLLKEYLKNTSIDLPKSYVIGDRETDVEMARTIGCKAARLTSDKKSKADFISTDFLEISRYIIKAERSSHVERITKETNIVIDVELDGTGVSSISTGIGFFDHMLELFSKHSSIDLRVKVKGDLRVDEHHTVEDAGLALGEAIRQALGDKRGIGRYGFLLPMDESLAEVAIDLSGRPYCVFHAKFSRDVVGELPTELVEDFFRAYADGLRANLHIKVSGRNDHHKIEAMFKATARALAQAILLNERLLDVLPSTKGTL
ncbi:MAG TPA: bifunctional histidinol-phosphatase/imidazoleglycerol-phosphate dehydratase HisB [Bacteroidota bacterium]|nr:bifunctional histidinol-phosphatase/imidazoleglycerol-phosphate dehydratase HisB [Bacteroidota bacterium]